MRSKLELKIWAGLIVLTGIFIGAFIKNALADITNPHPTPLAGTVTDAMMTALTLTDVSVSNTAGISASKIAGQGTVGTLLWSNGTALGTTTNLLWDNVNTRLGVGTATPAMTLSVQGTMLVSGAFSAGSLIATGTTRFNDVTYTWPSADGSSGQVIQTNGAGTLSFVSSGGYATTSGQALSANDFVVLATTTDTASNVSAADDGTSDLFGSCNAFSQQEMLSQSSTETKGRLITFVTLRLLKQGTPTDTVILELTNGITATYPATTTIASSTFAGASLTTSLATYGFGFYPAVYVPPNDILMLRVRRSGACNGTDNYKWGRSVSNPYANGQGMRYVGDGLTADSWQTNALDYGFTETDSGQTAGRAYIATGAFVDAASTTIGVVSSTVATSASMTIISTGLQAGFNTLGITPNKSFILPTCYRCNGIAGTAPDNAAPGVLPGLGTTTVGRSVSQDIINLSDKR